jgi:hypothetical protein
MPLAQRAVDLAKETIRFMATLNNTSNLYRRNQVFYHQFLTSAIAVLFLASTHAPLQFSSQCRTEFYMALELVKDMSARSWVSQRLWRTVRSLKAYAPRLGLGEDDQRSGAAMTMADLASGSSSAGGSGMSSANGRQSPLPPLSPMPVSRTSSSMNSLQRAITDMHNRSARAPAAASSPRNLQHQQQQQQQQQQHQQALAVVNGEDPDNGQRLGTEMKAIFEGYMGLSGRRRTVPMPLATHVHHASAVDPGNVAMAGPAGADVDGTGVYPIVRDLF